MKAASIIFIIISCRIFKAVDKMPFDISSGDWLIQVYLFLYWSQVANIEGTNKEGNLAGLVD